MKLRLVVLCALLALPVAPAAADVPGPSGLICGLVSVTNPNPEAPADEHVGMLFGGPLMGDGTLTCTIQVGGAMHWNANNGDSAWTGGSDPVVLRPELVSYTAPSQIPVYLCTQWQAPGQYPIYWDERTRGWSSSDSAACVLAISGSTDDPVFDPIYELIDSDPVCLATYVLRGVRVPGVFEIDWNGDVYVLGDRVYECWSGGDLSFDPDYSFIVVLPELVPASR